MDDSLLVSLHDVFRKQHSLRKVSADLSGHIVSLYTVHRRILIGVLLLYILIITLDQREDPVVRRVCPADKRTFISVSYISSGKVKGSRRHDLILYHILYLFHRHSAVQFIALELYVLCDIFDLPVCQASALCLCICLCDRPYDLLNIKYFLRTISLDYLHTAVLLILPLF